MTRLTLELSSSSPGFVTGRLVDADHNGEGIIFEVTISSDSTRTSQRQVVRAIGAHLDWFIDLSRGGKQ